MKLSPLSSAAGVQSGAVRQGPAVVAASASVAALEVLVGAQAESVQAAQKAIAALPAIDMERVAEIKEALARGDIAFDPKKLAGLIERHHRGR